MASFAQTFDATTVDPNSGFDVYPAGKYLTQIVASEMRPTKDGRGQYLFLELDILEGQFVGRKLFDRLNLVNDHPDTVDIATRTLSSICRATGQLQVSNSEQLHLIPMMADVRIRPPKGQYGESNSIRYLPRSASTSAAAPAASAAMPARSGGVAPSPAPVQSAPAPLSQSGAPSGHSVPAGSQPIPTGGLPWKRQA